MEKIYRHPITIGPEAIDQNGHVNNVVFVQWMQDAAVAHSTSVGGTQLTQRLNATFVARRHTIEYRLPAYLGEQIEVRTWVSDCRRVSSRRKYEFVRLSDNKQLAHGETDWVLIDLATLAPMQIPTEMKVLYGGDPAEE
jgi:acyl-CoA thioester hydrolase